MSDIDSVRVAVRIRPLVQSEIGRGCQSIIEKVADEPQIVIKNHDSYTFNYVYAPHFTQEFIYEDSVQSMIDKLFKGYNVTILAYGQTGSGKTHTMGTAFDGQFGPDTGVIPRAVHDIFKQINDMPDYEFNVTCSFMELYQEQLYDLLTCASREQSVVDIREDGNKGIIIPGLSEIIVCTAKETTDCLMKGSLGRAVGATAMNAQSSRSHAIFTITIHMMKIGETNSSTNSKFHLVDLAGSERSKKTKATGDRFKEGVKINQGLLALGNVISALGSSQGNGYVSYRDSKLTRLLQDSLGGNSFTLMIACVSPADYNMDESLSTLRYADRARKIKNKPIVNQDAKSAEINRLNAIIQKLRLELLSKKGGCDGETLVGQSHDSETMQKLVAKNRNLQAQLQNMLLDIADVEMRAVMAETAHDDLYNKITEVHKNAVDLHRDFNEKVCSNAAVEHAKKFGDICKSIEEITGVLEKNKEEMFDQQAQSKMGSTLSLVSEEAATEAVQRRLDMFTQNQLKNNADLRKLDAELNMKEALYKNFLANYSGISTYDENSEEKAKEFEDMIRILEAEKQELLDKLKSVKGNASAKIAEDRRIRLQQLEQQLAELRKKNKQQAHMLKVREKDVEKANRMTREIQEMKAAKVRLIRQMRTESENLRQWKLNREREISLLKEKNRKREHAMMRMETLHTKKENFLRSKVADAMAANKRLKEALDKQKTAQAHRKNLSSGKIEHLISWIDQELEVIVSAIGAGLSIEHLMEDRAALTSRLQELKDSSRDDNADVSALEEEIQMRNAQISDLQQRVVSTDIDSKIKTIVEGVQSMPECRAALTRLLNAIVELRKDYVAKEFKSNELKSLNEIAEEKVTTLEREIANNDTKYKGEVSTIQKDYEEKITVLLRELNRCPKPANICDPIEMTESQKIQEEQFDKLEELREELEHWKALCHELEEQKLLKKPKNKLMENIKIENELSQSWVESTDEDPPFDDSFDDPDWRFTPLRQRHNNSQNSRGSKRGSDGAVRCYCRGKCVRKTCGCRKASKPCSENCKCTDICENKFNDDEDISGEVINPTSAVDGPLGNETVVLCKATPHKSIISTESIIEDVEAPEYPFAKKKRKPFF